VPNDGYVGRGSSHSLNCVSNAYPTPRIHWSRRDGQPISRKHRVSGSRYAILNINPYPVANCLNPSHDRQYHKPKFAMREAEMERHLTGSVIIPQLICRLDLTDLAEEDMGEYVCLVDLSRCAGREFTSQLRLISKFCDPASSES